LKRILVGLSGGVDSAVSAAFLLEQGYFVEAAFMHNWHADPHSKCQAHEDYMAALAVAEHLGIPLHSVDFSTEYFSEVFEPFLDALTHHLTPNPDILCNRHIKFKYFLNYAQKKGFDAIATGHYAQIKTSNENLELHAAQDFQKDQTYFLHTLTQTQLRATVFPLASTLKQDVRSIAKKLNLPNHERAESMGICFIGPKNFSNFIRPYVLDNPGEIVTEKGQVIGEHQGLHHYTLGQRKGLGIGGHQDTKPEPWYVAQKKPHLNQLIVVQSHDHPLLYHTQLRCQDSHWIGKSPTMPRSCQARIRHRQHLEDCYVEQENGTHLKVTFKNPQRAITPGQSIVFYEGSRCYGGAMITST
jgi:tRNA-uridine 2-sulfurtransferase